MIQTTTGRCPGQHANRFAPVGRRSQQRIKFTACYEKLFAMSSRSGSALTMAITATSGADRSAQRASPEDARLSERPGPLCLQHFARTLLRQHGHVLVPGREVFQLVGVAQLEDGSSLRSARDERACKQLSHHGRQRLFSFHPFRAREGHCAQAAGFGVDCGRSRLLGPSLHTRPEAVKRETPTMAGAGW
jgi:hypothetical protein